MERRRRRVMKQRKEEQAWRNEMDCRMKRGIWKLKEQRMKERKGEKR